MKYFIAVAAFLLTLGLTTKTLAGNAPSDASCSPESETKCADTGHGAHGGHGNKDAIMNSLFPEKQQNPEMSKRPAKVNLTSPKFLSRVEGAAQLEWAAVSGANAYHVQVATDPHFKWLVVNDTGVTGTSYQFDKQESGKKYFWRVAAYNTHNESTFTKSLFNSSAFIAK